MAVGKNGMPTYAAPVRIIRPGEPGFPDSVTICNAQEIPMPASKKRCVTCSREYQATGNAQKLCPECMGKRKPPTKPTAKPEVPKPANAIAAAIGNLRAKAAPPPVAASGPDRFADLRKIAASYRQAADLIDQALLALDGL